jgi:nucleoside phosphorylase
MMMDTVAESAAAADVLTPGFQEKQWYSYAHNFESAFLPNIRHGAPATVSKRLGAYFLTKINGLKVIVFKTDLHMHQDAIKLPDGSMSLPIKDMLKQIIQEAKPKLFLTTGTSGGVYCSMHLGDVVVSRAARFQCDRSFRDAPFNHTTFKSDWTVPQTQLAEARKLMQLFASNLTGRGTPPFPNCDCNPDTARPTDVFFDGQDNIPAFHPIITVDYFEFGTSTNNLDKIGMAVEMDDAALGLACSELKNPPKWACVRNLSDATVNGQLSPADQNKCAGSTYAEYGYWTSVMSALAAWSIIAGFKS